MFFRLCFVLMFSGLLIPHQSLAGNEFGEAFRPIPADYAKTCNHYANRARFKERGPNADFDVILADACYQALRDRFARIDSSPTLNKRAEAFLISLTDFKNTIIALNMERAFGETYTSRSKPIGSMAATWGLHRIRVRPVSRIGEYLIAREMGLTDIMRSWAFAGGIKTAGLN